jgi:hypothetical protein
MEAKGSEEIGFLSRNPIIEMWILGLLSQYNDALRVRRMGFNSWQGIEIINYSIAFIPVFLPIQPTTQWVPGAVSPGVK